MTIDLVNSEFTNVYHRCKLLVHIFDLVFHELTLMRAIFLSCPFFLFSSSRRGFLGECDRVFLARRAFSLIHPSLCRWLNNQRNRAQQASEVTIETLKQIYRLHTRPIASNPASNEAGRSGMRIHSPLNAPPPASSTVEDKTPQSFAVLLVEAYKLCPAAWVSYKRVIIL